jgi:integrase
MSHSLIRGNDVFDRLYAHLKDVLKFSTTTLIKHKKNWDILLKFAEERQLSVDFNDYVSVSGLLCQFSLDGKELIEECHSLPYSVSLIAEFIRYGEIFTTVSSSDFTGPLGEVAVKYLLVKKSEHIRLASYRTYELHLSQFLSFLHKQGITVVQDISLELVRLYVMGLKPEHRSMMYLSVLVVKRFLKWLYENKMIHSNIAIRVPSVKTVNQPKIPSVYSKEEITILLSKVDRGNSTGKRDYLVLTLAALLGMRSSDICDLTFNNINWDASTIDFVQRKTDQPITLPLLPEVGNAIIDYLKGGRPKSDDTHLLLTASAPFTPLRTVSIYSIVSSAFKKAGINTTNKRHGAHSLRHSLASRMLENQTAMPVISEALGHTNTNSTMYYLRIDITSMRECQLVTTQVDEKFYSQFQ